MLKKALSLLVVAVLFGLVTVACAPAAPEKVVETVVVTEVVEIAGEQVVQEVVITATPPPEERKVEIFHWWTAAGEREAADAMFAALAAAYPDIEVVENPVAGGGGVSHRVVLQARLAAGIPPDTWQTLGGAELKSYVDGGYLQPLDDLYAELGYADVIPGPLAKAVTIDGHPYVVPLNMHLENILYYNKAKFEELGLEPPLNYEQLLAACEAIAASGMTPMAVGTKDKWAAAFVLDTLLLELGGPEYYVSLFKGEIDVTTDPVFRQGLERLAELLPYINTDHPALTWDQSVSMVGAEDAAMVIMGTWAIGAFTKGSGWEPGVDFGAVTFPQEPERILLFHPDTYGLATGAPHPQSTLDWLRVVASPELQIPTDVIQGGLFARTDIDPTEFPDPIRQELQQFVAENPDKLILDQHGSIAPFSFTQAYWDAIANFMVTPDVDATISAVATLFKTHDVKNQAAWYQWP